MDKQDCLEKKLVELIEQHTDLRWDENNRYFADEIYSDYRDQADYSDIIKWCEAEDPRGAFWETLDAWYGESCYERRDEILKALEENWPDEDSFEAQRDTIWTWLLEHVCIDLPSDHYLDQKVCVNIVVDTGDGDHDFVLNDVYPHYNGRYGETIHKEASILWLTRQQGYKKTQLNQALRNGIYDGSKLLKSLRTEVANCSTHMNALTFFVSMTLRELLELQEKIHDYKKAVAAGKIKGRNRKEDSIIIDHTAKCGLFDAWSGAGSILEIELEQDVVLPLRYVDSALPDGGRGYSMAGTYEMMRSFWTPTLKAA